MPTVARSPKQQVAAECGRAAERAAGWRAVAGHWRPPVAGRAVPAPAEADERRQAGRTPATAPAPGDPGKPGGGELRRRNAQLSRSTVGRLGEQLAATELERAGMRVIERNYRCRLGEIDLIACAESAIVIVEVKTRRLTAPAFAPPARDDYWPRPSGRQRRRLHGAALSWLAQRGNSEQRPRRSELRFDLVNVLLAPDGRRLHVRHLAGAF